MNKYDQKYSLNVKANVERCKSDSVYMGEVLLANEKLIWYSIHKYVGNPEQMIKNSCLDKDDILQVGRIGLIKAINAFDTERGTKFSSFSVIAVAREVRCFIRDHYCPIRPTRAANDLILRIKRLEDDLGYLPRPGKIAELLGESREKVTKALGIGQYIRSLDEPVGNKNSRGQLSDGHITLLDMLEDSYDIELETVDRLYLESVIKKVKELLGEKEGAIFGLKLQGLNQSEIAKKINVSKMKVSRVMKKIIALMEKNGEHL
ncbi:RNA polymerase sporulation specific sigma factor SigG [Desulfocucumis palustris]|uniref:RNA polymerase sporulation specific sigma factor SigG n=1 Tax=Desulfocucumis palustris TaxID=1898651 RepID=A0A2L2XH71_9FIRM|nr:sigma-70 family RNA polymerase sigma factor [Desulfocucumis palustris]GBF35500.1 RNA polymerase sporulation specific sigma factor SigG [Desulfocucumis palustris]